MPTKTFVRGPMHSVICGMEKDVNTTPPPNVNDKAYDWVSLHQIESVMGMAYDELALFPSGKPFIVMNYVRLERNKWFLMDGHNVVHDNGKPIVWNDTIQKAKVRPDVGIVNPKTRTWFTCGQ